MKIYIEIKGTRFVLKKDRHLKHYNFIMSKIDQWVINPKHYIDLKLRTEEEKVLDLGDFIVYIDEGNEFKKVWVSQYTEMDKYIDSLSEKDKKEALNFILNMPASLY